MQNAVMKTGTGTLVLSNSVTSNGNTITIQNGTLQFGDGVANNGTFDGNIVNNSALTFADPEPNLMPARSAASAPWPTPPAR